MDDDSQTPGDAPREDTPDARARAERAARLAAALRANLRRRKAPRTSRSDDGRSET
jgi:hypothetical protein